jgi:3-oxoacyl-[acyl-carrier-protein] synthase II
MNRPGRRRVVLTGIGAVTSIGIGRAEFCRGLREGRSGVTPITSFATEGFAHSLGCEVRGFDPEQYLANLPTAEFGRASQFASASARMCVDDAGLSAPDLAYVPTLVAVGTTEGESAEMDALARSDVMGDPANVRRAVAGRVPAIRLAVAIARELGLRRCETAVVATACAAGNYAIGYGLDAVRSGEVDVALCGGADAMCMKTFAGFYRLGIVAPQLCQPFDIARKGILTGEGAGIVLLESLDWALNRNAKIYCEVLGYGLNCDAKHPVAPDEESLARCVELAHVDAGIEPCSVDFISAHGTGTKTNDVTEAASMRRVFGSSMPPMISIKSMIGHTMGAASALGSIASALAIREGFIPPTINHERTDPECGIDCVPNHAIDSRPRVVQNNALAFGGNNCVMVLGEYTPDTEPAS